MLIDRISIENNILTGTDNNTSDDVTSDGIYDAVDHMASIIHFYSLF